MKYRSAEGKNVDRVSPVNHSKTTQPAARERMQLKGMRLALGMTMALIGLCALALALQVLVTSNYHIAVGDASDGGWFNDWRKSWYGRESSATLPTAKGAQADTYRWTAKEASLEF